MKRENKPILITGDFNMEPDSKEFKGDETNVEALIRPYVRDLPLGSSPFAFRYIFGDLRHEFRIINDQVIDIQSSDHLPIYIDVLF